MQRRTLLAATVGAVATSGCVPEGKMLQVSALPARKIERVAEGLLSSARVRKPERTFSLFTWLNNGGVIMDWLIAGIEETNAKAERVPTAVGSIAAMAQRLNLSRTICRANCGMLKRSAASAGRASARIGDVGFRQIPPGICDAQAVKLAIIDAAFADCFQQTPDEAAPAMPKVPLPMTVTPSEAPALSAVEGRGL